MVPTDAQANGWDEYKRMVLRELEQLDKRVDDLGNRYDTQSAGLIRTMNDVRDTIIDRILSVMTPKIAAVDTLTQELASRVSIIERDLLVFKTKAAVIGGVVGCVAGLIPLVLSWIFGMIQ